VIGLSEGLISERTDIPERRASGPALSA